MKDLYEFIVKLILVKMIMLTEYERILKEYQNLSMCSSQHNDTTAGLGGSRL